MGVSLLEDIQSSAIDSQSDLGTILRKCKLLAARLDSKPLEDWLVWESNGYPNDVVLPSYRIWPLILKGNFSGAFGSGMRNALIPFVCVPKHLRSAYGNYECRESVAAIESLLKSGDSALHISMGDLAVALGSRVYNHMNCIGAWGEFGSNNLVEVLNSVRNRILDFALAIWKESPQAGELGTLPQERMDAAHVTQIFQTTVYEGGSATVVGSAHNSSIAATVVQGNFNSLREALTKQGLSADDVNTLSLAVESDTPPPSKDELGPKVSAWLGRMTLKAAEGTLKAGGTVALRVISDALLHYYGITP